MKTVRSNTNLVDIARLRVHGRRVQGGYLVTNELEIFGAINAGEIVLQNLIVDDGSSLEFEANLDFDTLAAEPPISVPGLTSTMVAPTGAGLPVSSLTDASTDPDNDIDSRVWFVDGVKRSGAYVIPTGTHLISLRVIDARGATDEDGATVLIVPP